MVFNGQREVERSSQSLRLNLKGLGARRAWQRAAFSPT